MSPGHNGDDDAAAGRQGGAAEEQHHPQARHGNEDVFHQCDGQREQAGQDAQAGAQLQGHHPLPERQLISFSEVLKDEGSLTWVL